MPCGIRAYREHEVRPPQRHSPWHPQGRPNIDPVRHDDGPKSGSDRFHGPSQRREMGMRGHDELGPAERVAQSRANKPSFRPTEPRKIKLQFPEAASMRAGRIVQTKRPAAHPSFRSEACKDHRRVAPHSLDATGD